MISELSPDDVPWVPDDAEAEPEVPVEQPDKQADKAIIAARMQVVVLFFMSMFSFCLLIIVCVFIDFIFPISGEGLFISKISECFDNLFMGQQIDGYNRYGEHYIAGHQDVIVNAALYVAQEATPTGSVLTVSLVVMTSGQK